MKLIAFLMASGAGRAFLSATVFADFSNFSVAPDAASPGLRRRVLPVGSYIIATESLEPAMAKELSPRGRMMFDSRNFLSYWRLSPDGSRILWGGRASFAPTTVSRARDYLYGRMTLAHPQLVGARVEFVL